MRFRRSVLALAVALVCVTGAAAQDEGAPSALSVSTSIDGWLPGALDAESVFSFIVGGSAELSYAPVRYAEGLLRAGVYSLLIDPTGSLLYYGGAIGVAGRLPVSERWSVEAGGFAGLGQVPQGDGERYGLYDLSARIGVAGRISAAVSAGADLGYRRLGGAAGSLADALTIGVRLRIAPGEMRRTDANLIFESIDTRTIFPVLRAWYDDQPLGSAVIRNAEDGPIEDVRVSFYVPQYMGGPRVSAAVPRLERGESVEVPLHAVFDERVLSLTEGLRAVGSVQAEYSFLGSQRLASQPITVSFHHRNAMSWSDDRRASAFVSPNDPSALWFARYASSIVRDRMRDELPANVQIALGVFEALRLYGVNYVIDPNSAYVDMSENAEYVDYLQYPGQTLIYRGGDCDDLSILYTSLLESLGIDTAFITIPGHIFTAFDTGLSEAEARDQFFDPGLLLYHEGRAWAPIEITMVKEGFVKAWRVGAKQWIDASGIGAGALLPMADSWAVYRPSGMAEGSARFELPHQAAIMTAFDDAVDRFVVREFGPVIAEYEARLAVDRDPAIINEYGIALANAGLLDEAWEQFREAADAGFAWAWNNLGNVAFIRGTYDLAESYYEWAESLLPDDPVALLGHARSAYEQDAYQVSEALYVRLEEAAPELAAEFGYLQSIYGGEGRAWSMTDRLSNTVWSEPGLRFEATPAIVAATAPEAPAAAEPDPVVAPAPMLGEPLRVEPVIEAQPETAGPESEPEPEPESAPEPVVAAAPPVVEPVSVEPVRAEETPTPPAIDEQAPADTEIAAAEADRTAAAPPVISRSAPRDADIAAAQQRVPAPETIPDPVVAAALPMIEPVSLEAEPVIAVALPVVAPVSIEPIPDPVVAAALPMREPVRMEPRSQTPAALPVREPVQLVPVQAPEPVMPAAVPVRDPVRMVPEPSVAAALPTRAPVQMTPVVVRETEPVFAMNEDSVTVTSGGWTLDGDFAVMTDDRAMFAKAVITPQRHDGPTVYEFGGRSLADGVVGFGLHLHGRGTWRMNGYGGGDSLLVWVTTDEPFYGDSRPRLQVYRSYDDVNMVLLASEPFLAPADELHWYRVEYEPDRGILRIAVDGHITLRVFGLWADPEFDYAALRARDQARFEDLRILPLEQEHTNGASE